MENSRNYNHKNGWFGHKSQMHGLEWTRFLVMQSKCKGSFSKMLYVQSSSQIKTNDYIGMGLNNYLKYIFEYKV
jgi:hypothetical protein